MNGNSVLQFPNTHILPTQEAIRPSTPTRKNGEGSVVCSLTLLQLDTKIVPSIVETDVPNHATHQLHIIWCFSILHPGTE